LFEQTASKNILTRQTEVASLLHDRELARVTEEIERESNTKDIYFSRKFSHQESKLPHNSLSNFSCSLFVPVTIYRQPDDSFSHSKSFSQIQKSQFPSYGPRLRYMLH
jgi:hypothetical protein